MVVRGFSNSITIRAEGQGTVELPLQLLSGQINYLTLHNVRLRKVVLIDLA